MHVDVRCYLVREMVDKVIEVAHVSSANQSAECLTKNRPPETPVKHRRTLLSKYCMVIVLVCLAWRYSIRFRMVQAPRGVLCCMTYESKSSNIGFRFVQVSVTPLGERLSGLLTLCFK